MPGMSFEGFDNLSDFLSQFAEIPESVQSEMLNEMAEVASNAQKKVGQTMGVYDPEWSGKHVLDSITVKKAKKNKNGVMTAYVTFNGTRQRGNQKTRNAEIAFINEFGADRKNITARPFIGTANAQYFEKICQAGEKIYDRWMKTIDKE